MRALLLTKDDAGTVAHQITDIGEDALPDEEVTVAVEFSTINYKDALAITNTSPIVRSFPMIPGVDFAGTVLASANDGVAVGERVVLNGWEVGEKYWGGLAERARVKAEWLTCIPDEFSTFQSAAIGTAGYTAMLAVLALERNNISPDRGPVIVTGAAGGLGSIAVAILARLGYAVTASSGRVDSEGDYLKSLGATELIDRRELSEPSTRPMQSARWAGGVDVAGSHTLANVLAATQPGGCVAACGLAQGIDLPATVAPFILRGVSLVGIDSVHETPQRRDEAWARLASDLDRDLLDSMSTEVALSDVPQVAADIIAGGVRGRVVVDVSR